MLEVKLKDISSISKINLEVSKRNVLLYANDVNKYYLDLRLINDVNI